MADQPDVTDKAAIDAAYGALLDGLNDVALRNARKWSDPGLGRLSVFQVVATMAERFETGPDGRQFPVLDTNEGAATKPLEITFRIDGASPPPALEPVVKKDGPA